MLGLYGEYSATFLRVTAILTLLAFAIPISLAPLKWARALRWDIDARPDLALYFGRCLGVVALVLVWAAWHAAAHPVLQPFYFNIYIAITGLLTAVHVVGAFQNVQPWTETAEIPFWGGLVLLAVLFYPVPMV
jgi:hypothetical protein